MPNTSGSATGPTGSTVWICSAGTRAAVRMVVFDCVARIPSVFQFSGISIPGVSRSRKPWTRDGASPPESFPNTPSLVQTGAREVKTLTPV